MNHILEQYIELKGIADDLEYQAEQAINTKSGGETKEYFPNDLYEDEDAPLAPQSILDEKNEIVEERATFNFKRDYDIYEYMQENNIVAYHKTRLPTYEGERKDRMQLKLNKFF